VTTTEILELDVERIQDRAAALGVTGRRFIQLAGVALDDLPRLTRRTVSLDLLARLSVALDLPVPDLLTSTGTPPAPAVTEDSELLTSVLFTYGSVDVDDLCTALDWNPVQLTAAADAAAARLESMPVRLVRTDQELMLIARDSLPEPTRTRLEAARHQRTPLTADEASTLVLLAHHELLAPVAGLREPRSLYRLKDLASRGLIVDLTPTSDGDQATARPHPDLMFALRLTGPP
jgi:hypothetical protein